MAREPFESWGPYCNNMPDVDLTFQDNIAVIDMLPELNDIDYTVPPLRVPMFDITPPVSTDCQRCIYLLEDIEAGEYVPDAFRLEIDGDTANVYDCWYSWNLEFKSHVNMSVGLNGECMDIFAEVNLTDQTMTLKATACVAQGFVKPLTTIIQDGKATIPLYRVQRAPAGGPWRKTFDYRNIPRLVVAG